MIVNLIKPTKLCLMRSLANVNDGDAISCKLFNSACKEKHESVTVDYRAPVLLFNFSKFQAIQNLTSESIEVFLY